MKKVLLSFLAIVLLSAAAFAQPAQCRVNATIYKPSGAADGNFTLTVFRIVFAGQVYSNQRQTFRTNSSGVLLGADNAAGVSLPQGSVVWMYANAPGFDFNPNSGTAFQIPNTSTAQLTALASATTVFRALGDLVYGGTDGIPTRLPAGVNGRCLVMVSGIPAWTVCPGGGGGSSIWGNITGTLSDQTDLQAALDTKANTSALAAVALSGAYADLTSTPTLGTAAALNVAASGDAASGEVVKGDDTRLSDSRTPTSHTHAAADTISGTFDVARIPDLSGTYSVLAHTHTFASLTSTPTTLSGYGITDAQPLSTDLTTIGGLSPSNDDVLQRKAGAWTNRTIAQLRTDFGLAAIATSGSASDLGSGTVPLARLSGITASELSATAGITNGQLAGSIAYGKLNLTGAILNADLAGSIANAKLANSALTIAGSSTSLGGSIAASTILDSIGSTRGSVLYRGASGWAILTPGMSGQVLTSNGAGADPSYQAAAGSGITIGATTVTGATDTYALYNNAGLVGARAVTGTGNAVLSAGPTLTGTVAAAAATFSSTVAQSSTSATAFTSGASASTPSFQVDNSISSQASGVKIIGKADGIAPEILSLGRIQITTALAGNGLAITADPAIAGSSVAGAAAGGSLTLAAGPAARLTSGNANGGDVNLVGGAPIGTGIYGSVWIRKPNVANFDPYAPLKMRAPVNESTSRFISFYGGNDTTEIGYISSDQGNTGLIYNGTQGYFSNSVRALYTLTGGTLISNNNVSMGSGVLFGWTTDFPYSSKDTLARRAAIAVISFEGAGTTAAALASPARTPSQITSDQNNYQPGIGWFQRWSSDASRNITGLVAGVDGQIIEIWNVGSQNIVLQNENAGSTAANRLTASTGADLTIASGKCAKGRYDATSARWRVFLCN